MNRLHFQRLARTRRSEALVLLRNGNYDGAYYLCGYVVECALKACIAKTTRKHDFPDKSTVNKSHTHDLSELVGLAGLKQERQDEERRDPLFQVHWTIVKDWKEGTRYDLDRTKKEAHDLYYAVASRHGVLQWLGRHW
jgi:HEPN domain-containing protein